MNGPLPRDKRGPLKVAFVITSMPVGGAEVLLTNLIESFDARSIQPMIICLKEAGELGEKLSKNYPVYTQMLYSKWDIGVIIRLRALLQKEKADAVITVGAGDKMFWGRLAGSLARVPVICSALHSTGWPDGVGRLNRTLTPITDGFIAVAKSHGEFLRDFEKFPSHRIFVIPNGVDTQRFAPDANAALSVRRELNIPHRSPLVGIIAALRPEKNHRLLVRAAAKILTQHPETHFLVVGEGTERPIIEANIQELGLQHRIHMLGNRSDTPRLLAALDVFTLCSLNEANPVSILEALSCEVPVVSTNVGSVHETVLDNQTGLLVPVNDAQSLSRAVSQLIGNRAIAKRLGSQGRRHIIANYSLDSMVIGYQKLIESIYDQKAGAPASTEDQNQTTVEMKSVDNLSEVNANGILERKSGPYGRSRGPSFPISSISDVAPTVIPLSSPMHDTQPHPQHDTTSLR